MDNALFNRIIRQLDFIILNDGTATFSGIVSLSNSQRARLDRYCQEICANLRMLRSGYDYTYSDETTSSVIRFNRDGTVKVMYADYTVPLGFNSPINYRG